MCGTTIIQFLINKKRTITTSQAKLTETQNASEEQMLEQQLNDLLLKLN